MRFSISATHRTDFGLVFDTTGAIERLRFPPFHSELLDQDWWNAEENLGRIKVVISEGIEKGQVQGKLQFRPLANLVCFSFQPAPIGTNHRHILSLFWRWEANTGLTMADVLERAAIAWPNARMGMAFSEMMNATQNGRMSSQFQPLAVMGSDSHAHSPRRRRVHTIANSCYSGHYFPHIRPQSSLDMPDPFVDNQSQGPLPAFSQALFNGQSSNADPSLRGNGFELRLPDDQLARLVDALSPQARSQPTTLNGQVSQSPHFKNNISSQPPSLTGPIINATSMPAAQIPSRVPNGSFDVGKNTTIWHSVHASGAPSDSKHGRDGTDISMHLGCTEFPNCNHDIAEETHSSTDGSAKDGRGKKDGIVGKERGE